MYRTSRSVQFTRLMAFDSLVLGEGKDTLPSHCMQHYWPNNKQPYSSETVHCCQDFIITVLSKEMFIVTSQVKAAIKLEISPLCFHSTKQRKVSIHPPLVCLTSFRITRLIQLFGTEFHCGDEQTMNLARQHGRLRFVRPGWLQARLFSSPPCSSWNSYSFIGFPLMW